MNHRAQGGLPVLGVLFGVLVFVILWMMYFAGWLQDIAAQSIATNNLTGLEAFFWSYINLWVLIGVILGTLTFIYIGAQQ